MVSRSPNPSVGLNAATGRILEGWPHAREEDESQGEAAGNLSVGA